MKTLLLIAALLMLGARTAPAHMWTDPEFEDMIKDSALIAVVEVEKDGKFTCPVKAVDVLKGKAPEGTFEITGYNDEQMEERGIVAETLHKGDRVLAFLNPVEPEKGEKNSKAGRVFTVPTPSCGDLTIRKGLIRGGCYLNTWPLRYPPIESATVVELVRGAVLQRDGKEPEAAKKLIREKLTVAFLDSIDASDSEKNKAAEWMAHWLLWAAGDFGGADPAVILKAAASGTPIAQITAGRALRRLPPDDKTLEAAAALLKSRHSYAQAEAVRVLMAKSFDKKKSVEALLQALPDSSSSGQAPESLMDPIQNINASGRELMVRAIEHFKAHAEAEKVLVALIQDKGLSEGVFEALREHFLAHPSKAARDRFLELFSRCPSGAIPIFLRYVAAEKSPESLAAISAKLKKDDLSEYDLQEALETIAQSKDVPEKFVLSLVESMMQKHAQDEHVTEGAVTLLLGCGTEAALKAAADLLINGPLTGYTFDSAVEALALHEKPACPNLRDVLSKILTKQSKAKSEEPQSNHTASACILVADQALLEQVEQAPARLFHKGLRANAVKGMKLKMNLPADAAKAVTAWCELLAADETLGYGTKILSMELKRACGTAHRAHAVAELKRLITKPGEEVVALIAELSGAPKPP